MPTLSQNERKVNARARALARAIQAWLVRFGRDVISDELRKAGFPASPAIRAKGKKDQDRMVKELIALLKRFGLRQATDASRQVGGRLVPDAFAKDFFAGKEAEIQGIAAKTRQQVRSAVKKVVQQAVRERPRPSAGAVAQRIKERFDKDEGLGFGLSIGRASVIARTELGQAQNAGIFEGYKTSGVKYIEWVAYKDGRSGNRRHDKMDGQKRPIGKPFYNEATRNKLMFPGDPSAPIKDTINCRCTTRPVRSLE